MKRKAAAHDVQSHKVVSRQKWLSARKAFLAKEKQFTRLRDKLSEARRNLPWEAIDKHYAFEGPKGKETLPELFDGRSQLIIYHFMFSPEWDAGCPHCSHWADNFNGIIVHLNQRDVTMIAASRAPYSKLAAYEKRMGWTFKWVSSYETDFNFDFHVRLLRKRSRKKPRSTITRYRIPASPTGKASAYFTKTPRARCFTPTQLMRVVSTY
jgi:predicted dithiol-disulfide oxidoreductase (DUF899 family)